MSAAFMAVPPLQTVDVAAGGNRSGRAVAHGGGQLADGLGPAVARGKDARRARGAVLARGEPACGVELRDGAKAAFAAS